MGIPTASGSGEAGRGVEQCGSCKDRVWEPIKQVCSEAGEEAPPQFPPLLVYKDPKRRNSLEPRRSFGSAESMFLSGTTWAVAILP